MEMDCDGTVVQKMMQMEMEMEPCGPTVPCGPNGRTVPLILAVLATPSELCMPK